MKPRSSARPALRAARIVIRSALLLLATLTVASASAEAPLHAPHPPRLQQPVGHALDPADVNSWLDGFLPYALHSGDIAGAVVVVVKDGKVISARGYGMADVAAHKGVDPDRTLFRVGSITKLFTWTAVMQQVEAGRLNLDADVNTYLDFRIPPFEGRPVTLRQIMTHTAGFELAGKDTITFGKPIGLDVYLKRWVPARIYPAGTTPAYSNWGAALAGYIVQRVSGLPYAAYVEQRIFAPLGMRNSSLRQPLPVNFLPFAAKGYSVASGAPQPFEIIGPAPAGSLAASGMDIAQFMIAHLGEGRGLMTPRTTAMMHNSPTERVNPRSLIPPLNRMELGFIESNINGHEVIGHGGDTQYFHSLLALFVNDGVGLFMSFNSSGKNGAVQGIRSQLFENFADRYFPATPITTRVPAGLARQHARMMTGMWEGSGRAEGSFLALASLAGQKKITVNPEGELSIPSITDAGGAELRWDEIAPFVWRSRSGHERIAAQLADGRVVRWGTDSMTPIQVFDRAPLARNSEWLLPTLAVSLGVLLLTALAWPALWFVRRHYDAPLLLPRTALFAHRASRIASLLSVVLLCGWLALVAKMLTNLDWLGARSDGWLLFLQLAGGVVFLASLLAMIWNLVLNWRRSRWTQRLWNALLVLGSLVILYFAFAFGLLAMTVHY